MFIQNRGHGDGQVSRVKYLLSIQIIVYDKNAQQAKRSVLFKKMSLSYKLKIFYGIMPNCVEPDKAVKAKVFIVYFMLMILIVSQ